MKRSFANYYSSFCFQACAAWKGLFPRLYPKQCHNSLNEDELVQRARTRWFNQSVHFQPHFWLFCAKRSFRMRNTWSLSSSYHICPSPSPEKKYREKERDKKMFAPNFSIVSRNISVFSVPSQSIKMLSDFNRTVCVRFPLTSAISL